MTIDAHLQKVTIKETKISEMLKINEEQSRTIHKIVYSLKDYDRFAGFDAVVRLMDANHKQEPSRNQRNNDESIDESKVNESTKDNESKESKNKNKIDNRYRGDVSSSASSSSEKNEVFREEGKNAFVAFVEELDSEKYAFVNASSTVSSSHHESVDSVKFNKADLLRVEEERKANEAHAREQAAKYTPTRRKSFSEMAGSVPYDNSSPEAEKICRSFRGQLIKGMAPRMDALVKDTGLLRGAIESYLSGAPWVRKDDSSPGGIVVYLPEEASA